MQGNIIYRTIKELRHRLLRQPYILIMHTYLYAILCILLGKHQKSLLYYYVFVLSCSLAILILVKDTL